MRPELLRCLEGVAGVGDRGRRLVGRLPAEDEGDAFAGADGEVRVCRLVLAVCGGRGVQPQRVGSRDGVETAVIGGGHPGHDAPIAEPHPQCTAHHDRAGDAFDDADRLGGAVARRHEVGDANSPGGGVPFGFEDQGAGQVAAPGRRRRGPVTRVGGADAPVAVLLGSEEVREDGVGVEARQAQRVDGSVAADQRCGLHVADQCIVLDTRGHRAVLLRSADRPWKTGVDVSERSGGGAALLAGTGRRGRRDVVAGDRVSGASRRRRRRPRETARTLRPGTC